MIMLDTHVAVALYEGRSAGLSARALRRLDREPTTISPAVLLELELLHEIKRIRLPARPIADHLRERLSIAVASESFAEVTGAALAFGFTRDPFDRLIAGHAQLNRATLLTFDAQLHRHYADALA